MDNPFDQFDAPISSAPSGGWDDSKTLDPKVGLNASISTSQNNPFDQFDKKNIEQKSSQISDIPRQVGLTARYGIEGVGNALDFLSSPIRGALNIALPKKKTLSGLVSDGQPIDVIQSGSGEYLSNLLGLPKPQNAIERVVGDATRMMAAGALPMGMAGKAADLTSGLTQSTLNSLASNPLQQITSAGGAGAAGGSTREAGGGQAAQFLASLAGGLISPSIADAAINPYSKLKSIIPVDEQINSAIQDSGLKIKDLPYNVQQGIRSDVNAALKNTDTLSPNAIRRLADYRLTDTTPTAATLTLEPAMVSQQKNIAKLGINSKDIAAQQLGQVENANNNQLITGLNDIGAGNAKGSFPTGQNVLDSLNKFAEGKKKEIGDLYNAARDSSGRSASLDPSKFTQTVGDNLDYANINAFVPSQIRETLNKFATGEIPLNVNTAEQFKTIIGNSQRASNDGNVRNALGIIRSALDETPLIDGIVPAKINGGNQLKTIGGVSNELRQNIGQESIDAFNAARSANRNFMKQVEKTPALSDALEEAHPDKFFQKHIINSNVGDLKQTLNAIKNDPSTISAIKSQLTDYLKSKALNGAKDEVGNFSQSGYNKALSNLGDNKLSMFFSKDELNQLKAIGRVASYEQFQPRGAAVNNSNTAGTAMANILDRIGNSPLLSKIPFANNIAKPAQNISVGIQAKNALNVPNALKGNSLQTLKPIPNLLMSPAILMGSNRDSPSP